MTKYSHLSYDERVSIENGLNNSESIFKIAKDLKRSHSTILREIDRNKIYSKSNYGNPSKTIYLDYSFDCEKLNKKPYVCNGCPSRRGCRKHRYTYYAREAQKSYEALIKYSREGIDLTEEDVFNINNVISPLIKKGQTVNHIYINHPELLDFFKVTFYNYINDGVFEFRSIDLPRMGKYKKRKNKKRRTRKESRIYKICFTKKTSFKNLTQLDCNILLSHINSLCRESLNNKTTYEAMTFMCDEKILNLLNVYYIEPDDVQLNTDLLKK